MTRFWLAVLLVVACVQVDAQRVVFRNANDPDLNQPADATESYQAMTFPSSERVVLLYATDAALADARAKYAASPGSYPAVGSNPTNCTSNVNATGCDTRSTYQAWLYLMTGTFTSANGGAIDTTGDAIAWILMCAETNRTCLYRTAANGGGIDADMARYYGESLILTENWLNAAADRTPAMTQEQRETFWTAMNRGVSNFLEESFGSCHTPATVNSIDDWADVSSNYCWGFNRMAFMWGVSSYGISFTMTSASDCSFSSGVFTLNMCGMAQKDIAKAFLDEWDQRWDRQVDYSVIRPGGVHWNGTTSYGKYRIRYYAPQLYTAEQLGRDTWTEMGQELIEYMWWQFFATSPKATRHEGTGTTLYQMYSYGATQEQGTTPAAEEEVATFMTYAVEKVGSPLNTHARDYLTTHNPTRYPWYRIFDDNVGASGTRVGVSGEPLDYYASGQGHFIGRSTWDIGSSDRPFMFFAILANPEGHHFNCTAGSHQFILNTEWAAKESAVYGNAGYNLPDWDGDAADGYNVFPRHGVATANNVNGNPLNCFNTAASVLRTTRASWGWHGATDTRASMGLTATTTAGPVYDLVWLRDFNYVLTVARVTTTDPDTTKQLMTKCPTNPPTVSSDTYDCTVGSGGSAVVRKTQFLSGSVSGQTVDAYSEFQDIHASETDCPSITCDPQYSVKHTWHGGPYGILFEHAYMSGGTAASAAFTEDSDSLIVTITQSGRDTVVIDLPKGASSTSGGTVTIGAGAANNLGSSVTSPTITASGVTWP